MGNKINKVNNFTIKSKVKSVIQSCVTFKQINTAENLLKQWESLNNEKDSDLTNTLMGIKMKLKHGWNNKD